MTRRVVVTGMGTVNPLGNNVKDFWSAIRAGENGIGALDRFDTKDFSAKIAGQVKGFAPEKVLETKEARRMDPFVQYGYAAATQAIKDSIGQDMWAPDGKGTISLFGSKLVISQTLLGYKLMETAGRK